MKDNQRKLVYTAMFAAVVVVLQMFVSIPVGMFTITLTLIPIMLGAILFGPASGAFLGGVFGVVVAIQVMTGAAGAASSLMFTQAPVITVVLCILKGAVAGLASGLIYKAVMKFEKPNLAVILSAVACPIVNTGVFIACMFAFFIDVLQSWAAGADVVGYVITGLVLANFVPELIINIIFTPVSHRLVREAQHKK